MWGLLTAEGGGQGGGFVISNGFDKVRRVGVSGDVSSEG